MAKLWKKPSKQQGIQSLQVVLFVGVLAVGFAILAVRLFDLQILSGEQFRQQADANRFFTLPKSAQRGVFLDFFGDPLVYNMPKYFKLRDPKALYSERDALSQHDALLAQVEDPESVEIELDRWYRFPEATAAVLGYVGQVTAEDLQKDPALSSKAKLGKMGMERYFDEKLRGTVGQVTYEINALGQKQRRVKETSGQPGATFETTIDPYLSQTALKAMNGNNGAVVILDADSGKVLALVSTPTFSSTALSTSYTQEDLERQRKEKVAAFFSNPLHVFFNRAVAGTYPPGSIFKLVTALAGLESNALSASTTVIDTGQLDVGEYSYANWYYTQYGGVEGEINLVRALARSNDTYFYKAAEWIGPTKLAEVATLFGMGSKTGIELPGEALGLVPNPKWKEETIGEQWFLGNTFHMGIGQGDLLVSPLQIAQMIQTIAHRGTQCNPRLLATSEASCHEAGISEEHLELVVAGMLDACSAGGTAYPFFPHNSAVRTDTSQSPFDQLQKGAVACKTGTSEFGAANAEGHRRTHGWFASTFTLDLDVVFNESTPSAVPVLEDIDILEASSSAVLFEHWKEKVTKTENYPKRFVAVALVESDEGTPFREGSRDAAPVVKYIFDWMRGILPKE